MSAAVLSRDEVNLPAAVLSVAVHVALFAFLFFGIRWQSKLPDAVVVELWDRPPVLEQSAPPEMPKPEPRMEPPPEPKVEPRVAPQVEVKPPKPDIATEKEKRAPPKKKEEPKKVEPTVRKFDRAQAIQNEAERDLRQVSPAQRRVPQRAGAPVADNSYVNKIKNKVRSNVVLPPDIAEGLEAIFDVAQLPSGDVLTARLRKSSGNRAYDEAVERAILKSSPLPKPDRPEQFERDLQLKFRPKE
jgi:colicin import membrane protein